MIEKSFNVKFIGRKMDLDELDRLINDSIRMSANLIGIDGRRRVGKTALVKEYIRRAKNNNLYENNLIYLDFMGNLNQTSAQNVLSCKNRLKLLLNELSRIHQEELMEKQIVLKDITGKNWSSFFFSLNQNIEKLKQLNKPIIVFLDEICWFSKKDNFINDFAEAWNLYFSNHNSKELSIIMVGSSSSWMKEKIFGDNTVLYNRLTGTIHLKPFTLKEISEWIRNINNKITDHEIIQYYCVFGGIISYYQYFDFELSFEENFKNLFHKHLDKLILENKILYQSLFNEKRYHEEILDNLVMSKSSEVYKMKIFMKKNIKTETFQDQDTFNKDRKEFFKNQNQDWSNVHNVEKNKTDVETTIIYNDLKELENNDLVSVYRNDDGVKVFQLSDVFTLFFNFWIKKAKYKHFSFENGDYNYWKGYAFEIVVLNEMVNIFLSNKELSKHVKNDNHENFLKNLPEKENKNVVDKGFYFNSSLNLNESKLFEKILKDKIKLNHKIKKITNGKGLSKKQVQDKTNNFHQIDIVVRTEKINYVVEIKNYNDVWYLYSDDIQNLDNKVFDLKNEYSGKDTKLILITSKGVKISERLKEKEFTKNLFNENILSDVINIKLSEN